MPAVRSVQFDARSAVNGVSFDAVGGNHGGYPDGPPQAINPGQVNPPTVNPVPNNDGLRGRQVVIVKLPGKTTSDGTPQMEDFVLSLSRVKADGSEESLDAEFTHDELKQVAARIQALALEGKLCNGATDFSGINIVKLNLHRGDRMHAFTLQRVRFAPNGGALVQVQDDLYAQFMQNTQEKLSELGQTLAKVHSDRRERQEELRKHGEHPSQKNT